MSDVDDQKWPYLRVLHIIITVNKEYGGPVEGLTQSIKFRQKNNQDIEVVTLDNPDEQFVKDFSCKVHGIGPVNPKYGYTSKLKNWIITHAHRFDVAVIHGLWNPSSIEGWQGCTSAGLPYVMFTHGMMDPWFKKAYPLKHLIKQLYWFIQGRVLRDAHKVLFTSAEEQRLAQGVFWGYNYKSKVVAYAAADVAEQKSASISKFNELIPNLKGQPYLLYLSRIHEKKGCDLLLKGFAKAVQRPELQLVMAGPCNDDFINKLKDLAKSLGISNRVHWPGMLKGDFKASVFQAAEAFVLTSHQENFGIAVAEALAYGKPVLISDQINIWREIETGNGGIVASDTVEGATEILIKWEKMIDQQRVAMGMAARKVYENNFTVKAAAKDLTNVLFNATCQKNLIGE